MEEMLTSRMYDRTHSRFWETGIQGELLCPFLPFLLRNKYIVS